MSPVDLQKPTVNELIRRLQYLQSVGHGDSLVYISYEIPETITTAFVSESDTGDFKHTFGNIILQ